MSPPLVPFPGHSNLFIRIVPKSRRYHLKLSGIVELFTQEEGVNVSLEKKEVGSLSELLRATEDLLKKELRRNHPPRVTIRAFVTDYLGKLFPEAQDEIAGDIREAIEPILEDVRGIGPKVVAELRKKGITDIHQLARTPEEILQDDIKYLGENRAKQVKEEVQKMRPQDKEKEKDKKKEQLREELKTLQHRLTK